MAAGSLADVAVALAAAERSGKSHLLVFDDSTGMQVDLNTSGSDREIVARYTEEPRPAKVGRPRLGVVAREVTLLPEHWEWLSAQPGGASVTLRKLVSQARKENGAADQKRTATEAAYRFMNSIGGNLPQYEEVTRALFAGDLPRMKSLMADWPEDVRDYALTLNDPANSSP